MKDFSAFFSSAWLTASSSIFSASSVKRISSSVSFSLSGIVVIIFGSRASKSLNLISAIGVRLVSGLAAV